VLTIENSRSGDAMVSALAASGYGKDLGPGVYDVHSPQVRRESATLLLSIDHAQIVYSLYS
jgi:methionine synthase II (cobalamin-independent)